MTCAGCRRRLEVGDQFIQFTGSEFFERDGGHVVEGRIRGLAMVMGSGLAGCSTRVYGDET